MKTENSIDAKLEYALEMTFPASDPFTISLPEVERVQVRGGERDGELTASMDRSHDQEGRHRFALAQHARLSRRADARTARMLHPDEGGAFRRRWQHRSRQQTIPPGLDGPQPG